MPPSSAFPRLGIIAERGTATSTAISRLGIVTHHRSHQALDWQTPIERRAERLAAPVALAA